MAEHKDTQFKTAEQKKRERAKLKCKVCGKKVIGKSTLSRHISHAHDEMDPADREKLVIDAFYGHDVVERTIRKFKNGEYRGKAVPIDIGKYLRLAEIKPNEEKVQKIEKDGKFKQNPKKYDLDKTKKLLVRVIDNFEKEKEKEKRRDLEKKQELGQRPRGEVTEKRVYYLKDLIYSEDSNRLFIIRDSSVNLAMDYRKVLEFIEENDLGDSILFVSMSEDKEYPVLEMDIKEDDKVTDNRIKCTVTYSTEPKKED